MLAIPGS